MNCDRFPSGSPNGEMYWIGGTQWNTVDVSSRSSVASQKLGIEIPIRPSTRAP